MSTDTDHVYWRQRSRALEEELHRVRLALWNCQADLKAVSLRADGAEAIAVAARALVERCRSQGLQAVPLGDLETALASPF